MKNLTQYIQESILSSTKSGRKSVLKSFGIKDIGAVNPEVKLNKIFYISKMKEYLATNTDIIVFNNDKHARVFAKFLCSIVFTTKEWDILSDSTNPEDVDLLLKNKLKPFIKEKTINDYSFCVDEEKIIISVENEVNPKELLDVYVNKPTIVWFNNNFEF